MRVRTGLLSFVLAFALGLTPALSQTTNPEQQQLATFQANHPCESHEEPWIEVIRPRHIIKFWCGYRVHQIFPVGLGKQGWETEQGKYKIQWVVKDPIFVNPFTGKKDSSPNNPISPYFIGVYYDSRPKKNFWVGFHGTPDRNSVGKRSSHGCMRMYREDVTILSNWVTADMLVWIHDTEYVPPPIQGY